MLSPLGGFFVCIVAPARNFYLFSFQHTLAESASPTNPMHRLTFLPDDLLIRPTPSCLLFLPTPPKEPQSLPRALTSRHSLCAIVTAPAPLSPATTPTPSTTPAATPAAPAAPPHVILAKGRHVQRLVLMHRRASVHRSILWCGTKVVEKAALLVVLDGHVLHLLR
mmetsp:Transcript_5767/g.13993  ORF Transcript_5767/g.13993 Transcript_5767/m.13993 type:complete len:166 (-) Transcript_5767:127-624(-)